MICRYSTRTVGAISSRMHRRAAGFDHTRYVEWGTGFADFDNNGWPDIMIVTGNVYPEVEKLFKEYPHRSPRLVYQNLGNGRFKEVTAQSGARRVHPQNRVVVAHSVTSTMMATLMS